MFHTFLLSNIWYESDHGLILLFKYVQDDWSKNNFGFLQMILWARKNKFGKASRSDTRFCRTDCSETMRNLEKRLKTQNQNGPIYFPRRDFPKNMHDLRYIDVFLRGKFQVAKINSDTQSIHSLDKYIRKFRDRGMEEIERRILILSLLYIISFVIFFLFKWSNGWLESLGEWTSIFK